VTEAERGLRERIRRVKQHDTRLALELHMHLEALLFEVGRHPVANAVRLVPPPPEA